MSLHEVRRSALVTFTPEQMFDLVIEVERYPEFLPWVSSARLLEKSGNDLRASMEMHRAGIRERFSTYNRFDRPHFMTLELAHLARGPFRTLDGRWSFSSIAEMGTRIDLEMRFEFANPVLALIFGRSFEQSLNALIDAFVARAKSLHGERA